MSQYIDILLPEHYVILGLQLEPLTLGHLLYLEHFECLEPKDEGEFALAVIICSQKPADVIDALSDPWLGWKVRLWRWRLGWFDWREKAKLYQSYIEAHTKTPAFRSLHEGGNSLEHSGTPHVQHVRVCLMSKLNYTPAEAFACPFGQAMFDYLAFHESEGAIEIIDREHRAKMKREVDQRHAELVEQFRGKL